MCSCPYSYTSLFQKLSELFEVGFSLLRWFLLVLSSLKCKTKKRNKGVKERMLC